MIPNRCHPIALTMAKLPIRGNIAIVNERAALHSRRHREVFTSIRDTEKWRQSAQQTGDLPTTIGDKAPRLRVFTSNSRLNVKPYCREVRGEKTPEIGGDRVECGSLSPASMAKAWRNALSEAERENCVRIATAWRRGWEPI